MNIFVVNSGSSSIKYELIEMPSEKIICSGIVERVGKEDAGIIHKTFKEGKEQVKKQVMKIADHAEGLKKVVALLTDKEIGVIKDVSEIDVVGHRVVHGGETFTATTIVTQEVKDKIKKLFPLAPLHNPLNYVGIEVTEKLLPKAKQVAVFDTAFHQTIPPEAFRYAIPSKFYKENKIRVYGFHGTSHKYVSGKAIDYLKKENSKIITIHLGNGCSMTAVKDGKSIDTSMGFGPMNGLIMGTRAGDIDQSVVFYLTDQLGYDADKVKNMLNYEAGMTGLTGHNDMRDVIAKIESGDNEALLAYQMYAYRIRKYIGSYMAALNGLDAIVFTGGIGENDRLMRKLCSSHLECLGIQFDEEKNNSSLKQLREINTDNSSVRVLVIPTNEELEIAMQCYNLLD
ncbi:MAG TPA: acetate kinase [Hanamia sp.]|nr:acetate kinase [Hanamia sp.]